MVEEKLDLKDYKYKNVDEHLIQKCTILQKTEQGFGITVAGSNPVFIQTVKPDGAAAKSGIMEGDKIIKVNGTLVLKSDHTEVVNLMKSGSYVALTLLGRVPPHMENHHSHVQHLLENNDGNLKTTPSSNLSSDECSFGHLISAPQAANRDKNQELRSQKIATMKMMEEQIINESEKMKMDFMRAPSEQLQLRLEVKQQMLSRVRSQMKQFELEDQALKLHHEKNNFEKGNTLPPVLSKPPWVLPGTRHRKTGSNPESLFVSTRLATSPNQAISSTAKEDLGNERNNLSFPKEEIKSFSGDELSYPSRINQRQNSELDPRVDLHIMSLEDDDFLTKDDHTEGVDQIFVDIERLKLHPAHLAVFLHYLLSNDDPNSTLFYLMSEIYISGGIKDSHRRAYEIFSTFIHSLAPLRINIDETLVNEMEAVLSNKFEREDNLRNIFKAAQKVALEEIKVLLSDFRNRRASGLGSIFGDSNLKELMTKVAEFKIIEDTLWKHFERLITRKDSEQSVAIAAVLATYFKQIGFPGNSKNSSKLDRCTIFNARDQRVFKFPKSNKKIMNGHQLVSQQFVSTTICHHCHKLLWGPASQGMQCTTCETALHKQCCEEYQVTCTGVTLKKGKERRPPSMFDRIIARKLVIGRDSVSSLEDQTPSASITAFHSIMVDDDDDLGSVRSTDSTLNSPSNEPNKDFNSIVQPSLIGRSESLHGRHDSKVHVRRALSDVSDGPPSQQLNESSGCSSNSSLSNNSLEGAKKENKDDSLTTVLSANNIAQLLEVEVDLPTLDKIFSKEQLKKMKPKERKQQEVINEIIHTERVHMRNLVVMHEYFYAPMIRELSVPNDFIQLIFPNLEELISLHGSLKESLKIARTDQNIIENIGQLFLKHFSGSTGDKFKRAAAKFCKHQSVALETLKHRQKKDPKLAALLLEASANPYCRRFELKDLIPSEMQRLTKYPLLLSNLIKFSSSDKDELNQCLELSKEILNFVNQQVEDSENRYQLADLQKRLDTKQIENSSHPAFADYKKLDLSQHRLVHSGPLKWHLHKSKNIDLLAVLLDDILVLLQKSQEDKLVLRCQGTNISAAKDDSKLTHSPILNLKDLIIRDVATDKRAFFIVSIFDSLPQIYELVAPTIDEKKRWVHKITMAVDGVNKKYRKANEFVNESVNEANNMSNFVDLEEVAPVNITTIKPSIYNQSIPYNYLHGFHGSSTDSLDESSSDETRKLTRLVHPHEVKVSRSLVVEEINSKMTSQLMDNMYLEDAQLTTLLAEKRLLLSELLHISPEKLDTLSQVISRQEMGEADMRQLLLATMKQADQLSQIVQQGLHYNQEDLTSSDTEDNAYSEQTSKNLMLISASQITSISHHLQTLLLQLMEAVLKTEGNNDDDADEENDPELNLENEYSQSDNLVSFTITPPIGNTESAPIMEEPIIALPDSDPIIASQSTITEKPIITFTDNITLSDNSDATVSVSNEITPTNLPEFIDFNLVEAPSFEVGGLSDDASHL